MNPRTRSIVCLLIALAAFAGPVFSQGKRSFESNFIDGVQLYTSGNYEKALSALELSIEQDPDNDAVYYYMGLTRIRLRDRSGALEDLKKAVELDSTNYWYRQRLARLYSLSGNSEITISMYEDLLDDFPKRTDLYYDLVNLYIQSGQNDKALATIDEIENEMGKSDGTVMTRFNILRELDKGEEAYAALKEFNEEYSSPQILSMLGDYEMGMYNDSSALAYYNEALSLDSTYAPAKLGQAETYRITRQYSNFFAVLGELMDDESIVPEAKSNYLDALLRNTDPRFFQSFSHEMDSIISICMERHPGDTAIIQTSGIYYYATRRVDEALEIFKSGVEKNPSNLNAWGNYLTLLAEAEEWNRLVAESYSAYREFPDNDEFIGMANSGLYQLEEWDEIILNCRGLLDKHPDDPKVQATNLATIGDMFHNLGNPSLAFKYYNLSLKVDPNYCLALNNYAYFLSLEGKSLKKAYKMSKATIVAEPDNATYLDTFGWILHLLGKDVEAKAIFKHAMLYGGKESSTILEHYSIILEALGERDLAKVYRTQAKTKAAEESAK